MSFTLEEAHERQKRGQFQEAEQMYTALLEDHPDHWMTLFFLGTLYLQTNRNGLALQMFKVALQTKPNSPELWNNIGTAYKRMNCNDEAKKALLRCASMVDDADAYSNLSTIFINEGCPEHGLKFSDKALEVDNKHYQAHWNRSLLLLEMGRYEEGFEQYFWGIRSKDRITKDYNCGYWKGQKNKNVVVYGEQGIGDELMFASCLPDLIKDSKNVIFDCHPRLIGLFERSFGVKCYPTRKDLNTDWHWDENIDYKTPIGNLPHAYRKSIKSFPGKPYIKVDPEKVKAMRAKLEELGPGPYIGVSWYGGKKKTRVDLRSMPFEKMMDIFKDLPFTPQLVSMQYTKDHEIEAVKAGIPHWGDILYAPDYEETAALAQALDLVISVNTSLVHLCGAIGQEVWVATPQKCAWRYYSPDNKSMPWYGSATIYKQEVPGEWEDLVKKIAGDLTKRYASDAPTPVVASATGG